MTQEKANKIFSSDLGQQLSVIYVTSDDRPFIRYEEASKYAEGCLFLGQPTLEDKTITEWYPEDELSSVEQIEKELAFINKVMARATKDGMEDELIWGALNHMQCHPDGTIIGAITHSAFEWLK